MAYGKSVTVAADFAVTVDRVRFHLAAEGFSVLTEIDVSATMKAKLGADLENYLILGACNAPMAYEALKADRRFGLLLPCNVVVRALDETHTVVEALNPKVMVDLADQPDLEGVAEDAAKRLDRMLSQVVQD